MTTSNIEVVEIGIPGPPGAGVSSSTITTIQNDIATLQNDLDIAEGLITTLQNDLDAAEATIDTLEQMWWGIEIDGGGSAITTGVKRRIKIPYDCTITADPVDGHIWQIGLDQSGSISLDLWMDSYTNYPPTNADRISGTLGSQNPRVSSAIKNGSGSTTGWTLNLVGGRYLFVDVASAATATFATLGLYIVRT